MKRTRRLTLALAVILPTAALAVAADQDVMERFRRMSAEAEERGLAEPFRGVTTHGEIVPGLFGRVIPCRRASPDRGRT